MLKLVEVSDSVVILYFKKKYLQMSFALTQVVLNCDKKQ